MRPQESNRSLWIEGQLHNALIVGPGRKEHVEAGAGFILAAPWPTPCELIRLQTLFAAKPLDRLQC